ncbi:MAG: lipid-A-disaccharide synthase [Pedobacter sp.]|nr:MAG: lipid-A-disaccharide synthase [Pedobacter sp.]
MKYYLVAGEASGDLHGANLMQALKEQDQAAEFRYFGGPKMEAVAGTLVKHYKEMAFMGFTEVLLNLRTIFKNLSACKSDILSYRPDAIILIDFPGFNLKIAAFAKENNIPVYYYISPKVWAWNQKRVLKIKEKVDHMLCILPFEVDFYAKWGMQVHYIGNPLLDEISRFQKDDKFIAQQGLDTRPLIALLPGSRKQEIDRLLPEMATVARSFPDCQFMLAASPNFDTHYYQNLIGIAPIKIAVDQTYNILAHAHAALVASGTATLETAIFQVPQVVLYKGGAISIAIARLLVKIRFISLVNLIMDKAVVKELIQEECNSIQIQTELSQLLAGPIREEMLEDYKELAVKLGKPGASQRAAQIIYQSLDIA